MIFLSEIDHKFEIINANNIEIDLEEINQNHNSKGM